MKEFDPQTFKTLDAASYDSLTEQFDYFIERLTLPLAAQAVALAQIKPTENILDIGTGTGIVALQAAQIIDSKGTVDAIDLSQEMLAKAAEKAKKKGVGQKVKFSRMDAEALTFEDEKFDVAVSLFALLHFPNPLAALGEIRRVLRPEGRLVVAVGSGIPIFSPSGWIHLVKKIPEILRNLRGKQLVAPQFLDSLVKQNIAETDEPEESDLANHTHHNRTQTVVSLVKKAGFEVLKTDWRGHQEIIDTPEEFWEIQRTFSSIARKRLSKSAPEEFESVHKIFLEKCRKIQSRGGRLVYPFGAFYVVARRPE